MKVNMTMKRITLLFSLLLSGVSALFAQPALPDKCQVFYPEVLLSNVVLYEKDASALMRSSDFGQNKQPRNVTFWIVYSDRDDNTTYTTPGGSTKFKTLSMNDRLRIAEIKNGYALVYSEPQEDIAYPLISQDAECMGWISMKNLLIWHSCPANDAGIYNKALLCVNVDKGAGAELGKLYYNPRNKNKFTRLNTNMNFYYVMKREGNLALLAQFHTSEGHSDRLLMGWVSEDSYVAWNQRSCIEPTWKHRDAEYFADENEIIKIYSDVALDSCVSTRPFVRKQSAKYDQYLYRMHPDELRFPLLDDGTDELYSCSTFGPPPGADVSKAQTLLDADGTSPLGFSEKALKDMTNINIGIVIDGTRSMEPFYGAVKEAIKEGCKYFNKKYKVKVGIVIYRDYCDGKYTTELVRLTPSDNPKLYELLDTGGEYGIKSSVSDRTKEEALYEGINVALDQLGFRPEHSNLLLVVGDCGNDREDNKISKDALVAKLVQKDVDIMGFQVSNGPEDAYGLFNTQLTDLIKESLEMKYTAFMKSIKVQMKEVKDGYELVNDKKSNLYVGSHKFPLVGQQVKFEKLSSQMQEAIRYCSESVQTQIDLIASLNSGGFNPSSATGSFDINEEFLKHKLGKERYEQIKQNNSLVTFKGYSRKKHKSGREYFKPVIFITSDELNALIAKLKPVADASVAKSNNREPYVEAMKALLRSMVSGITEEEINRFDHRKIMNMVAGLNEAASALKGYPIMDIASPQVVSHNEYYKLVADFTHKYNKLNDLKNAEYKYTRTFNGLKYYWLPIEYLP